MHGAESNVFQKHLRQIIALLPIDVNACLALAAKHTRAPNLLWTVTLLVSRTAALSQVSMFCLCTFFIIAQKA
jgi:hypothetical protein